MKTETPEEQMARIRRDEWQPGDVGFLVERLDALEKAAGSISFLTSQLVELTNAIRRSTQQNVAQLYSLAGLSKAPPPAVDEVTFHKLVIDIVKEHNEQVRERGYEAALYDTEQALMPTDACLPSQWERRKQIKSRLLPKLEWHDRDVWNAAIDEVVSVFRSGVGITDFEDVRKMLEIMRRK